MEEPLTKSTTQLIVSSFELEIPEEQASEQELFDLLCDRIAYLIEYRIDFLLSLMYRLDVAESKINKVLSPSAEKPANVGLAELVMERQRERMRTKKEYKATKSEDWEGLGF